MFCYIGGVFLVVLSCRVQFSVQSALELHRFVIFHFYIIDWVCCTWHDTYGMMIDLKNQLKHIQFTIYQFCKCRPRMIGRKCIQFLFFLYVWSSTIQTRKTKTSENIRACQKERNIEKNEAERDALFRWVNETHWEITDIYQEFDSSIDCFLPLIVGSVCALFKQHVVRLIMYRLNFSSFCNFSNDLVLFFHS